MGRMLPSPVHQSLCHAVSPSAVNHHPHDHRVTGDNRICPVCTPTMEMDSTPQTSYAETIKANIDLI
jgi:hypothetical protein